MNIPLKRGMLIRHQNHVYSVTDFQERHTGKQRPTVHVSLRDVRDGHPVDRTLADLEPIEEVSHAMRAMQYLYAKGGAYVFMDSATFEEHALSGVQLHGCEPFLKEGEEYRVMFVDDRPLALEMPEIIRLAVAETAAPSHSVGNAGSVLKEATLENHLVVRVPLFIKMGDTIRVDTRTRTYVGKE
ncbi:MAG TPA: elongation factor P [Phycisphaerae bacterium]|nr:elongation factor P [Phycisphaerae bacterium]HPM22709.1 elongation factor P [Phycisphaerae bacterium]